MEEANKSDSFQDDDLLEFLTSECQLMSQRIGILIAQGPKIKKKPHTHSASASLAKCNEIFVKEREEDQGRENLMKEKISLTNQLKKIDEDISASKFKFSSFTSEVSKIRNEIKEVKCSLSEKNDFIKILEENHHSQIYGKVNKTDFY